MKNTLLTIVSFATILTFSHANIAATKSKPVENTEHTTSQVVSPEKIAKTVNLNIATAKEIANILTGIGMKKAQAIVNYRQQHGLFKTIAELAAVKGIGVVTISKNEGRIVL